MKTSIRDFTSHLPAAALLLGLLALSCNKMPSSPGQGSLCWRFSSSVATRSVLEVPDTDSFILTVSNSAHETIYDGPYGRSPESILVNPGSYSVRVVSREFNAPAFEAPQFGDEQVVVVKAGTSTLVTLDCTQLNCGLRLRTGPDFVKAYPAGSLRVSSSEGSLDYGSGDDRTGYFLPGALTIFLDDGTSSTPVLTRTLEAREMLTLGIACPDPSTDQGGGISIHLDTLRTWSEEEFSIGSAGGDAGVAPGTAYSASDVRHHAGEKGVWVCGFIVGGDLSSSKNGISFEGPFESMTCIALASRASVTEKASCVAVQLAKGRFRDELNLVDHPELLGCKVYLKGDIEASYYGLPGIKNLTDCSFE
ncbi:MAG: DUF4493 domain-containing protein [Bacteroidales bacterium]|nr:DUF4493 domain-containing protein [Bacteroidales bacterium]